jgi:sugar lactone lactonase YvrE
MKRLAHSILAVLLLVSVVAAAPTDATHTEARSIIGTPEGRFQSISSLNMDGKGNLLVCEAAKKAVLVVRPDGKLVRSLDPGFAPNAACEHEGSIYVGGTGKIVKLDGAGKAIASVDVPDKALVAGIATTPTDVFAALRIGFSFTVYRYTHDLTDAKPVIARLRGCCGQMHIVARDGVIYAAENARKRVVRYDREGKELGAWGKDDRKDIEGFGSCCNPMNLCFGPRGELYTSESQGRVKRYTPDGKFLGLVGKATVDGGCVNISLVASADGSRVFVLDRGANAIRVLEKNK